ncbi:MAG TPA: DUF2336 domain-containing protein [Stellaceae bacterium]|nr:DUF2336 domain-containing protein [Stellaceae bacterium]
MAMLTREVIAQLIEEASWTERAKSLERLAARFSEGGLDESEWHAATDAFRVVLYDAEPLVRLVLAETVKLAPDLPRDILLALARDAATVATPILEHSRLLSEDDLLPIVQRHSPGHRFAIAGRRLISGRIAAALAHHGERPVLLRLLMNDGAAISEQTLHALLDRFPDQPALTEAIARRRLLPVSVGSRLFAPPKRAENGKPALRLVWDRTGSLG